MAVKKYSSTELTNDKGKKIETRGIDGKGETVTIKDSSGKDVSIKVEDAISDYVIAAEQEKLFKEQKEKAAEVLRLFVGDARKYFSDRKDYTKTYRVFGKETPTIAYAVDVSSTDKATMSAKNEDVMNFKRDITAGIFNQIIEEVAVISIKKTVTDDDKKRRELTKLLIDTLGEDKVKEYFVKDVSYEIKSGLSTKIYDFASEVQAKIKGFIKFASDAVKDASTIKS